MAYSWVRTGVAVALGAIALPAILSAAPSANASVTAPLRLVALPDGMPFAHEDGPWGLLGTPVCDQSVDVTAGARASSAVGPSTVTVPMNTSTYSALGVPTASTVAIAQIPRALGATSAVVVTVTATCAPTGVSASTDVAIDPVSGAWSGAWTSSAQAAPASGTLSSPLDIVTSAVCPVGTGVVTVVRGPGLPDAGYNAAGWTTISSATVSQGSTSALKVPVYASLAAIANDVGAGFTFNGDYTFAVGCRVGLDLRDFGTYDSVLHITDTGYTSVIRDAGALSIDRTSSIAVVVPAGAGPGVLRISVGGSVVYLAAVGAEIMAVPISAVTSGSVSAVLDPDAHGVPDVVGAATVTALGGTSVALSVTGTSVRGDQVTFGSAVNLVAVVSPDTSAGTVVFRDGGTQLGSGNVVSGSASLTLTSLPVGAHSLSASFRPADGSGDITSNASLLTVVSPPPSNTTTVGGQTVTVPNTSSVTPPPPTVAAQSSVAEPQSDALTVTLAFGVSGAVGLPIPSLSADGRSLETSGSISNVTVTDTRSGAPGFCVVAQISDLLGLTTGLIVPAGHVGLTPTSQGSGVQLGLPVPPAAAGAPTLGAGLSVPRVLATAQAGFSGSVDIGADLLMRLPTDTASDMYQGYLVITVS